MTTQPSTLSLLARATRVKTVPVLLSPVAVGAVFAWYRSGRFDWLLFVITLVGAAAGQAGGNALNDYFDQRSGVDKLARIDRTAVPTASGLIESGVMRGRTLVGIAVGLLAVAGACGVVLAMRSGIAVLVIGGVAALLAVTYVAPPIRYGYIGHGLGEAGLLLALGPLPVLGAAAVQSEQVLPAAALVGVIPGVWTMLIVFQQNFLHWKPDRAVGKWTLVAWLEPERALIVDGALMTASFVGVTLLAAFAVLPAWSLLSLIGAPPLAAAWSRAFRDPMPQTYLGLLGAALGAALLGSVGLIVGMVLAR